MANAEDDFDPKKPLAVEAMTKSEFQRWLMDQDSLVYKILFLLYCETFDLGHDTRQLQDQ